jgi:hypothetical protein
MLGLRPQPCECALLLDGPADLQATQGEARDHSAQVAAAAHQAALTHGEARHLCPAPASLDQVLRWGFALFCMLYGSSCMYKLDTVGHRHNELAGCSAQWPQWLLLTTYNASEVILLCCCFAGEPRGPEGQQAAAAVTEPSQGVSGSADRCGNETTCFVRVWHVACQEQLVWYSCAALSARKQT